jgi:hypothetical protein
MSEAILDDPAFENFQNNSPDYASMLQERLIHVSERSMVIRSELDKLKAELESLDEERSHLEALIALAQQSNADRKVVRLPMVMADAESVVGLLREVGRPLHYREIAKMIQDRGVALPGGADPANALLAKYFDDPRLYRPSRGTYALRLKGNERSVGQHKLRREAK